MAKLDRITSKEKGDALSFAIDMARTAIGEERGYISPNARLGSLSNWEWEKIAMGCMSGWIAERSRQVTADRLYDEPAFLATGEIPEPYELGLAFNILPGLGELVEKMGLTHKPIGSWSRDEIALFVWTCADMMNAARTRNDERPEPDATDFLMAG